MKSPLPARTASVLLVVIGLALLAVSGLFSAGASRLTSPTTDAQFLERTGAALAFLLAYLCYFFTRKS